MALNNSMISPARELVEYDRLCWSMISQREATGLFVEVAELLPVPDFVVGGKFQIQTQNSIPGGLELAFGIKIIRGSTGAEAPNMTVKLAVPTLQNQAPIERILGLQPNDQWVELILPIPNTQETHQMIQRQGYITFSMTKVDKNDWLARFLFSGVQLRSANPSG